MAKEVKRKVARDEWTKVKSNKPPVKKLTAAETKAAKELELEKNKVVEK